MLQIATERLRRLWPNATISVITDQPGRLAAFCPNTIPVSATGRWRALGRLTGYRFEARMPAISRPAAALEAMLARRSLGTVGRLLTVKAWITRASGEIQEFRDALEQADLVLVSGAGSINDAFPSVTETVVRLLREAQERHIPTAMLGQGIGPLVDARLWDIAAHTLPAVGLIGLREGICGPAILNQMGVPSEHVVITGDDALELARSGAVDRFDGDTIGTSIRVAAYSGIDGGTAADLLHLVALEAKRLRAPLTGLPTSFVASEADERILESADVGVRAALSAIPSPRELISQTANCRVVVTGSYHAAVFALGQGVPVVALVGSTYYRTKFVGLAELFPTGCRPIWIHSPDRARILRSALDDAWECAGQARPMIIREADAQITRSRAAYERLRGLVAVTAPGGPDPHHI